MYTEKMLNFLHKQMIFFRKSCKILLSTAISFISLASCSLNYGEAVNTQSSVPEFIFRGASYKRYEEKKLSMELNADTIEQYKTDSSSFASNAQFRMWNKNGSLETEGSCKLLGMNSQQKLYTMFTDIVLKNHDKNMEIRAQNLKWNGTNEQLVSGKNDTVYLKKDDLEREGKGFSASGISKSFAFTDSVSGSMSTASTDISDAADISSAADASTATDTEKTE